MNDIALYGVMTFRLFFGDDVSSCCLAKNEAGSNGTPVATFPNQATSSHFDDKVAQKYLLEAAGAPLVPTWVFHTRHEALTFLASASYPLVFKLRRGAGSMNVRRIDTVAEGRRVVARMFGHGIAAARLTEKVRLAARSARGRADLSRAIAKAGKLAWGLLLHHLHTPRERGYALFQRFVPGNDYDIRVTVIGERVFTFRRRVRPGDFRASGSGGS